MSMSSIFTIKDITYGMEAMVEDIPFQWAQALHFTARLMSRCFCSSLHGENSPLQGKYKM